MNNRLFFVFISTVSFLIMNALTSNAQKLVKHSLTIRSTGEFKVKDGLLLPMYGFATTKYDAPNFPAPTVFLEIGDTFDFEINNISQFPQTVYIHGFGNLSSELGNPTTSFAITHRMKYTYRGIARRRGCYPYYGNASGLPSKALGMYGMVLVNDVNNSNESELNQSNVWLGSEIDTSWLEKAQERQANEVIKPLENFKPSYFLINFQAASRLEMETFKPRYQEKNTLCLVNVGLCQQEYIFDKSLHCYWVASDGSRLPKDIRTDTIRLSAGERQEIELYPSKVGNIKIMINFRDAISNDILHHKILSIQVNTNNNWHLENRQIPKLIGYYKTDITETQCDRFLFINILGKETELKNHLCIIEQQSNKPNTKSSFLIKKCIFKDSVKHTIFIE
jgi:FtsP/CotA-like multicopper oxidase with cupredoxin domain